MKSQSVATALNQVREARNSTSRDKQQQFDLSQVATQGPEGEQKFAEKGIYDEDISPQFQRYFDSGYNNLQVDLDAIYIPEPPADASQSTRMELEELDTLVQEAKLPPGIMQVADKDPLRLFYSVAKKKGLEPLEQEAREWADDWTKLSFEYKMKFKRRRPWEVKKEHDIDFVVNKSDTTESPSYPSGHAMMGYGVAEFYKDTYPLMSDEWDNIADIIAHSRLQMGVHYPSDVEASKKIVAQVSSSTKQANMASDAFNKVKSAINKDVLKTYRKSKTPLAHLKKVKKFLGNEALEAYDRAETGYDIIDEIMRGRHFLPATLLKFSSEYSPRTISEQGWAEEEHSNTKVPRWFRESAMQEAIADELGFTEESAPTFHKDQNPELQGRNAYYDPTLHQIHYDTGDWTPGVLAHEIGHSTMDISPTAKAFNLAKDLTQVSTLPLALAASSMKINPRSPTLMRALKSSGGVAGKLKALVEGAKGRGGRWALGASALAGLGTVLEEARASSKGYSGIDRLVEDGIMSEEQGELAKGTMKGAFGTYLMGTPINVGAGIIGHKLLGGAARKLLPNKVRLGLAGTMGALSAGSILAAHLGGYRNVADNPLFGKTELLNNPLHELNTKTSSYTTKESRAALKNLTKLTKGLRTSSPATMAIEQGTRKAGKKTKNLALRAWTHPKAMELSHKAQDWFTPAHNEVGSWGMSPIWKKFGSVKHLEQRRLERAKFMSQDDLARLEKQVSRAKDLPEGANYITLPHGRKGVIRTEEGRSFLATILDARMRPPGSNISSKVKTAADKLRLYHGSPSDLGTLEPRQPNKGNWGDPGVYGSPDPLVAALYAIARNESRGSWGVTTDGKLIARSKKELNPEGYVYGYDSDDYIAPPEDDLGIGYASQSSPEILSKEKVYLDNLRDSITRVDGRDKFLEYFKKTSEDHSALSVLTAVPTQNLDLIMRKGLYSQKAMLDDPEIMAAFLAQRNADKAWKNDEQYDEKRFREQYDKRLKLMEGRDAPLAGPSVFFTEPDPDKVSDPRHFINQFDTQKLRVNLAKLLQDIPETRIQGAELLPYLPEHHDISDEEWDVIAKQRQRDLSPEEVAKYIGTDPKELWKDYGEEHIGKYYAANVPHAFIRTPSGIIPPEYLEQVEKTSSDLRVLTKEANANSILKTLEKALTKVKAPGLADSVSLYRARRNLGNAVKDLHKYTEQTARFGQMPRIVIPKTHLDIKDLKRLGFRDSLVAVPEIGQKTWTTYRHPLDKLHLHDHGDLLNMHIDSLPSLQMLAERRSMPRRLKKKLLETIPEGIKVKLKSSKKHTLADTLKNYSKGIGHAILEGGPGYINYGVKQLNPLKIGMAEEILSKLPKDYLKKRYGYTRKLSSEYLEQVEKTSSAMDRLKGVLTKESNLVRQATTGFNTLVKSTARGASNVGGKVKQFKQNHVDALKSIPINKKTITSPSGQTHTFTRTLQDNANINKFRKYRQRRAGARGTTLPARQPLNTSIAREAVKNPNYRRDVGHYVAAAPGVAPAVGAMSAGAQFVDDIGGVIGKFANHSSAKEQLKHILVTGHSGAGKSTYAKELAEELGIPRHRLDVTTGPIMEAEYPEYWDKGTLGYPEDVSTRVIQEALALDTPHVIEGSHILEVPELTEGYKRILIDTPEDRVVEQRAQREYRNQGRKGKPYRPIEKHREAAKELVDFYRDLVSNYRDQPGVESIVPEVKTAQDKLKHILITGQSGSGKTTEAKRLAEELGMPAIHLDQQKGFGAKGKDPDYIEDVAEATQDILKNLKEPHIVEGTQLLSEHFPVDLLKQHDLRILEADEDELIKRLTERGWNTESGRELKGPESADEAKHVVNHQRKYVDKLLSKLSAYKDYRPRGTFLAETARDLVPEDKQHLVDDLIARIGRSRIQQGVHSHQDVEAGEAMGREAAKIYKELGIKTSSPRLRTTIFGVDQEGKLLHGFGREGFYKFPGGGVDIGESITGAAKRELLEEAGYEVDSIEELVGLDTSDHVGATSAKGHMGHGSSLTKYLLARLGKHNESLLGSEGDAIGNLQTAPIDEVLTGLEGDMLFGSGVAESNHSALSKLRDVLQKTSAYKDYRPRGTLYLLDGKGGVMADKPTESYGSTTPYHFPGGGIFEEEKIDRLPTAQEVTEGIEREALEELGTKLKNVRMLQDQPVNIDMPDWWRERQRKKRGLDYKGIAEFYAAAERGDLDKSIYGADNDEFRGTYYPIEEVAKSIEDSVKPGDEHYDMSTGQARLLRSLLEKTSSEQPLLRHRSTLLVRDPETNKLLAANNREDMRFNEASPFYFPGGGLYDDEYDTPRTPTEEEILEGARREALEELGISLTNPRVVGGSTNILPQKWRDKALKKRGVPYEGGHEHLVLADKGDVDNSLYNVEGDAFTKGDYYDPQEVYDSLYEYGQQGGQFSAYNVEQAKAIREHLLGKVN